MNSLELFLLLLFIVMIYLVVVNKLPSDMLLGAIALWSAILWIGLDNAGSWKSFDLLKLTGIKKKPKYQINKSHRPQYTGHSSCPYHLSPYPIQSIQPMHPPQPTQSIQPMQPPQPPQSPQQSQQSDKQNDQNDPIVYSEENYKYNMFDELGSLGDNALAHKMKQTSNLNRQAMDNFSRMQTKYSAINYFAQELKEAANMPWWDNEELEDEF